MRGRAGGPARRHARWDVADVCTPLGEPRHDHWGREVQCRGARGAGEVEEWSEQDGPRACYLPHPGPGEQN